MDNGPQYPPPPMYNPYSPGPMPKPERPPAMRRAMLFMYAGAGVSVIAGFVTGLSLRSFITSVVNNSSTPSNPAVLQDIGNLLVVAGIVVGIIDGGVWLWMAWKTGAGRNWARTLSTVFFALACLDLVGGLFNLVGAHSATTANGTTITLSTGFIMTDVITSLVQVGIGLAAIILLYQRDSSQFFEFAKQAAAYGGAYPPYPPYPPPGYGQPAQYGQPPQDPQSPRA